MILRIGFFILLLIAGIIMFSGGGNSEQKDDAKENDRNEEVSPPDQRSATTEKLMDFSKGKLFRDIDLNRMQGLEEIHDTTQYPFVFIQDMRQDQKRIVFRGIGEHATVIMYRRHDEYWLGEYEYRSDTGYIRCYQFVEPSRITEFEYEGSVDKKGFLLRSASVYQNNRVTTYQLFIKGVSAPVSLTSLETIKDNYDRITIESYEKKKGKLYVTESSTDRGSSTATSAQTICFDAGNHTIVWCRHFGYNVICK